MRHLVSLLLFSILFFSLSNNYAQSIDVKHYNVSMRLTDESDRIEVNESIRFEWKDTTELVSFDLFSKNIEGKGMLVSQLRDGNSNVAFRHEGERLILNELKANGRKEITLELYYSGIPADGLVIGKNKFGDRTFFADNWPNRAHHWLACRDDLTDKATIAYHIAVPAKYEVIANGRLDSLQRKSDAEHVYHYFSEVPLPAKVIVIGVANFVVDSLNKTNDVEVSSWVYPQNKQQGFYDLALAPEILQFYEELFGKYEYEKLANVQSTTRYGGMENAGCIFYDEYAINGSRSMENLIAHELVHQWFGNSATEKNWSNVWLSEGFATYFTNYYVEKTKGVDAFRIQMKADRSKVLKFVKKYPHAVVDSTYADINDLLNANSYQRGSWVLHMLRLKIGDSIFLQGVREYYKKFRLANADTEDFKQLMEQTSHMQLDDFFNQWLYQAEIPYFAIQKTLQLKKATIEIEAKNCFTSLPLTIEIMGENGLKVLKVFQVNRGKNTFTIDFDEKIIDILIDPKVELLFEWNEK